MKNWVAAYDISDDKRRNKVARILDGYGDRAQDSVFELILTEREMDDLKRRLAPHLVSGQDLFRLYPLCSDCSGKIINWGVETKSFDRPDVLIL